MPHPWLGLTEEGQGAIWDLAKETLALDKVLSSILYRLLGLESGWKSVASPASHGQQEGKLKL